MTVALVCVRQDEGLDWGLCLRRLASYDVSLLEGTPVDLPESFLIVLIRSNVLIFIIWLVL